MANYIPSPTISRCRHLVTAARALMVYDTTPQIVARKAEGCAPVRPSELAATAATLREAADHLDHLAAALTPAQEPTR